MSTREIHDIAHKQGTFLFADGATNQGMIVPRYNIRLAKIEYFFIPSSRVEEYRNAKERQEHEAYRYYGNLIEEGAIKKAIN